MNRPATAALSDTSPIWKKEVPNYRLRSLVLHASMGGGLEGGVMLRAYACVLSVLLVTPTLADPISEAKVIAKSQNPVGAALSSSAYGCNLLGPPSPQRDLAGSPGPGAAGTITVPTRLQMTVTLTIYPQAVNFAN